MTLHSGDFAPVFTATTHLGEVVDLSAYRGSPVLLSFYRYASCPVCNLRVQQVIRAHAGLAAQGVKVVAVFQSPTETLVRYVGRQDAPFPILGNPKLDLYRLYGVEARWRGLFSVRVVRAALKAFRNGFAPGRIDGPFHRVPGDFLLNEDGVVALAHYGRDIDDHLPLEAVQAWLAARRPAVNKAS